MKQVELTTYAPPYMHLSTVLKVKSQDIWFCLYLAKLVQFLQEYINVKSINTIICIATNKSTIIKVPNNLLDWWNNGNRGIKKLIISYTKLYNDLKNIFTISAVNQCTNGNCRRWSQRFFPYNYGVWINILYVWHQGHNVYQLSRNRSTLYPWWPDFVESPLLHMQYHTFQRWNLHVNYITACVFKIQKVSHSASVM